MYDVFGLAPQTLQGADRLSALASALVLVPDFFDGDAASPDWFPADTPEKEAARNGFLRERADVGAAVERLVALRGELAARWPGVEDRVGVFGLCFGGRCWISLPSPPPPFGDG